MECEICHKERDDVRRVFRNEKWITGCQECIPVEFPRGAFLHMKESKRMMKDRLNEEDYHEAKRVQAEEKQFAVIDYTHRKVVSEMSPRERERLWMRK